jgi:DNA-binding beta-propeller fold protein YncE
MGANRSAQGGLRRRRALRLTLPIIALALLCSSTSAGAATPFHPRTPALDLEGLDHACGVAVDSKGDLYASSAGESKVLVFSPADHETPIGELSNSNEPCGLAVTSKGTLYVSEQATGEVVRYLPVKYPFEGAPSYGPREVIDASGQAKGIAVDPFDDRLYVAEGERIDVYGPDGSFGANDETQSLAVVNTSGGEFTLSFEGETTAGIPFGAAANVVQKALEDLPTIGPGNVEVESDYFITFTGALGDRDVELLQGDESKLTGSSSKKIFIGERIKGFDGHIGEGDLSDAIGVAPYTYDATSVSFTYHLAVADAAGDQLKLFSAKSFKKQKLRQTLDGPSEGEEFGFGASGANLAADPGTCPPAGGKACTAGHLFLYDQANEVIDELEATGQLASQTSFSAADGEPTAFAVDRSGTASNGALYASTGAGAEARVLAYGAISAPSRSGPIEEQSLTLKSACSVAIDDYGNRYVAVGPEVKVYGPTGTKELTKFSTGTKSCRIAIDSAGNVYAVLKEKAVYFKPASYPPKEGTTYGAAVEVAKQSEFSGGEIFALAVNPANDHLFVIDFKQVSEYDSAANGSKLLNKDITAGLGISPMFAIAVYGATGNLYISTASGNGRVYVVDPTGKEIITQITGVGSPDGSLGNNGGALAVDQSNGHVIAFEAHHEAVEEYEASGAFVATYGSFESLVTFNYGVAVDNGSESPNAGSAYLAYDDPKGVYDLSAFGPLAYEPPPPKHQLSLEKTGGGKVTSAPAGIDCGSTCTAEYDEGTEVVLAATPAEGSTFVGWSGCEAQFEGKCEVSMQEAAKVKAEFTGGSVKTLKVLLEGSGEGTVTSEPAGIECEPTCEAELPANETLTLTASPDPGSEVEAWEGCAEVPSPNVCKVTMDEDREVKLTLGPEHPLLSVIKEGSGEGEVTSTPTGIDCGEDCTEQYDLNDEVTLKAIPAEGSEFQGWSGCDSEPGGDCLLTMEGPRTLKATFTELPQAIAKAPVPLTYTEATLRGEVLTAGLDTEYHFEYLTEAQYIEDGESFANAIATPTQTLSAAKGLLAVQAKVSGLSEGTAYRFLLVVVSEATEASGPVSDEGAFTTLKEAPLEECPNAALRTGAAASLPDCRAYELVSPAHDGGYIVGWIASGSPGFPIALAASGGESVIFETFGGPLPGIGGNGVQNGYRAQRGAEGWSTASYGPTYDQTDFPGAGSVSVDHGYSLWTAQGETGTLDPEEGTNNARYLALPAAVPNPACGPEAPGRFELIGCGSLGSDPEAIGRWISPEASHVIFTSDEQLEPEAPASGTAVYDRAAGSEDAQVVSLLPGNKTPGGSATYEGVSADGSAVAFGLGGALYVRLEGAQTLEVGLGATFAGLSRDGSALFCLQGGALYRYDTATEEATQIAPSGTFVNVPAGGTSAYFTSNEDLAAGAEAGEDNLYRWEAAGETTSFVAILAPADLSGTVNLGQWVKGLSPEGGGVGGGPAIDPSRATPDGKAIVFQSHASLTGYEAQGNAEIFRYDASSEELACISCGPEGTTASSDAQLQDESPGSPVITRMAPIANLSEDGNTAFFTSDEPLLPADQNGVADVYEWREGQLSLISTGHSAYPSFLYAVSASGDDAFFSTREALAPGDDEDGGSLSIYDARVEGGFPAPEGAEECEGGEACRGAGSPPPNLPTPPTTSLPPEPTTSKAKARKCPKGKHRVKRKGKVSCVKRHKRHAKAKHRR